MNYAVIVAGGSGSRMGSSVPKQFMLLNGRPILLHTLDKFLEFDPNIHFIVVLPERHIPGWEQLAMEHRFNHHVDVAIGGKTRYESVQSGLRLIDQDGVVGIHDAVRPFVSTSTLQLAYDTAKEKGNAIPCIPVNETVREVTGTESSWVDRSKLRIIQTPQCFRTSMIEKAYNGPELESYTDDASVAEQCGVVLNLVRGNKENIKITNPEDLILAKAFLDQDV